MIIIWLYSKGKLITEKELKFPQLDNFADELK